MFKTNFSGHNKVGKNKKNLGDTAQCPSVATGLLQQHISISKYF